MAEIIPTPPSFYFKTSLILLSIAVKYMDFFIHESGIKQFEKHRVKTWIQRMESVGKEATLSVSPETAEIIRKEILEDYNALAIHQVLGLLVQMDADERREVEIFTENILKIRSC